MYAAMVLILFIAASADMTSAIAYLEHQNLTEPLFVFVILQRVIIIRRT